MAFYSWMKFTGAAIWMFTLGILPVDVTDKMQVRKCLINGEKVQIACYYYYQAAIKYMQCIDAAYF